LSIVYGGLFAELEAAYELRKKDANKKKKLKKSPPKMQTHPYPDKFQSCGLSDNLPSLDLRTELAEKNSVSKQKPVTKQRGVPKAKYRNKSM
jgi:hypothetical protein